MASLSTTARVRLNLPQDKWDGNRCKRTERKSAGKGSAKFQKGVRSQLRMSTLVCPRNARSSEAFESRSNRGDASFEDLDLELRSSTFSRKSDTAVGSLST
jgi:hypothetical protein